MLTIEGTQEIPLT